MKKSLKKQWIDALHSGNYKQGRANLHHVSSDSYCCLGVLAKCMNVPETPTGSFEFSVSDCSHTDTRIATLPDNIANELLKDSRGHAGYLVAAKLTHMNDHEHKSFVEIADWVEENVVEEED